MSFPSHLLLHSRTATICQPLLQPTTRTKGHSLRPAPRRTRVVTAIRSTASSTAHRRRGSSSGFGRPKRPRNLHSSRASTNSDGYCQDLITHPPVCHPPRSPARVPGTHVTVSSGLTPPPPGRLQAPITTCQPRSNRGPHRGSRLSRHGWWRVHPRRSLLPLVTTATVAASPDACHRCDVRTTTTTTASGLSSLPATSRCGNNERGWRWGSLPAGGEL